MPTNHAAPASLAAAVATSRVLAGSDYAWTHRYAPATISADHSAGLRSLLADAQGGLCAGCGRAFADLPAGIAIELCHIVSDKGSKSKAGIMPGNAYAGCRSCNMYDLENGAVVDINKMVRPDLVSLSFPTRAACVARYKNDRDGNKATDLNNVRSLRG